MSLDCKVLPMIAVLAYVAGCQGIKSTPYCHGNTVRGGEKPAGLSVGELHFDSPGGASISSGPRSKPSCHLIWMRTEKGSILLVDTIGAAVAAAIETWRRVR